MKGGFTLIELAIAMAIVAILAATAVGYYANYKDTAYSKQVTSYARSCVISITSRCASESTANPARECVVPSQTRYLTDITFSTTFSSCGQPFEVTVRGRIRQHPEKCYIGVCRLRGNEIECDHHVEAPCN